MFKYEDLLGKEIWDVLDEEIQQDPGAFLSAINSYASRKGNLLFISLLMNMIILRILFLRLMVLSFIGLQHMVKDLFVDF